MLIIDSWFGRNGNNILQLKHCIQIALFYKHEIKFNGKSSNHKLFNIKFIENYFNKNKNDTIIKRNFYYKKSLIDKLNIPEEVFDLNIDETRNILKESFKINQNKINKLNEDDVVIHIRSGDIFDKNPHPDYTPPPLDYFINILNNIKVNKIIILCEDTINPVVNKLLLLYKNAIHNINSLEEDIKIILSATTMIASVGSFIPSFLFLSSNIKNYYTTQLYSKELKDYYEINRPWLNNNIQRNNILNYKIDDIYKNISKDSTYYSKIEDYTFSTDNKYNKYNNFIINIDIKKKLFPFSESINIDNLKLTIDSLTNISLPHNAEKISMIIKKKYPFINTITDMTAGVGGNSINFCKNFKFVNSIESNKETSLILENNLKEYKFKNFKVYNMSCLKFNKYSDLYFYDAPWQDYDKFKNNIDLYLDKKNIINILKDNFCLSVPLNYNIIGLINKFPNIEIFSLKKFIIIINSNFNSNNNVLTNKKSKKK
jgi:16S rRNA G966 N2-methylase RsmD